MFRHALLVTALLVGCKKKQEAQKQAPFDPVASQAVMDARASDPTASAIGSDVEAPTGVLAAGSVQLLGCFAWSSATKTPACIGGMRSNTGGDNEFSLDILDGRKSIPLTDPIGADTAALHNRGELAGFERITVVPGGLTAGKPVEVVKGLTLTLTEQQTKPGGENEPPTKKFTIQATCGKTKAEVFSIEDEGSTVTAATRVLGDVVLVETINNVAREGESFQTAEAARIEVATCKVTRSGGQ
jgi:hypothetical protein